MAVFDHNTTSLLTLGRQCAQLFVRATAIIPNDEASTLNIHNSLSRFKIWAGSIGLFAVGLAGIDFRFQNDLDTRDLLDSMLRGLIAQLEHLIQSHTDSPAIEVSKTAPRLVSPVSAASSSDGFSLEEETLSGASSDENIAPNIERMDEIISRLYRLLKLVKKPNSTYEDAKVISYKAKAGSGNVDDIELESHIRWFISRELTKTSPILVERIVSAAIHRRWRILYKNSHYQKLRQDMDGWFVPRNALSVLERPLEHAHRRLAIAKQSVPIIITPDEETTRKKAVKGPTSATIASSINKLATPVLPKSVVLSVISKSAVTRQAKLDVPSPPRALQEGNEAKSACPYCCAVIGSEMLGNSPAQRQRWVRHVVQDCSCYVCLFDDCLRPTQQYRTMQEWIDHMSWNHASSFHCKAQGHESEIFQSRDAFQDHLITEHEADYSENEITTLINNSEFPIKNVFDILGCQSATAADSPGMLSCLLCGELDDFTRRKEKGEDAVQALRQHIAAHLEQIALLSLPFGEKANSDYSNSSNGDQKNEAAHHMDSSLPPVRPPTIFYSKRYLQEIEDSTKTQSESADGIQDKDMMDRWSTTVRQLWENKSTYHRNLRDDEVLRLFVERHLRARKRWYGAYDNIRNVQGVNAKIRDRARKRWYDAYKFVQAFNTLQEMNLGQATRMNEIPKSSIVALDEKGGIARAWIQHCDTNHRACHHTSPRGLPRRIIDVGDENHHPCICEGLGQKQKYVALSYCWTIEPTIVTTQANLDAFSKRLPVLDLPALFRDAIYVTRYLGFRYIWINHLCVLQHDVEDWTLGYAEIPEIFKHASLTVAASGMNKVVDQLITTDKANHYELDEFSQKQGLDSRAWAFQEQYLSHRILRFERSELAWSCVEARRCECQEWIEKTPKATQSMTQVLEEWRTQVVEPFSRREMTVDAHRLVALNLVAAEFEQRLESARPSSDRHSSRYLAGHWRTSLENDLTTSLCWFSISKAIPGRSESYIAPSWSWPSLRGPIAFDKVESWWEEAQLIYIGIVQYLSGHDAQSMYGRPQSGSLQICAPLVQVRFYTQWAHKAVALALSSPSHLQDNTKIIFNITDTITSNSTHLDRYVGGTLYPDVELDDDEPITIYLLLLGLGTKRVHGLLLRDTPGVPSKTRVGYVTTGSITSLPDGFCPEGSVMMNKLRELSTTVDIV